MKSFKYYCLRVSFVMSLCVVVLASQKIFAEEGKFNATEMNGLESGTYFIENEMDSVASSLTEILEADEVGEESEMLSASLLTKDNVEGELVANGEVNTDEVDTVEVKTSEINTVEVNTVKVDTVVPVAELNEHRDLSKVSDSSNKRKMGKVRSLQTENSQADTLAFFQDERGNTKYRDPITKQLHPGGILIIDDNDSQKKYIFDEAGNLAKNKFVNLPDGRLVYAQEDGQLLERKGLLLLHNNKYIFQEDNSVLLDDWYEIDNKRVYAAPLSGKLYTQGAFTVKDGVRYAFDVDSYLVKGYWVDEPGYGRAYGRPSDGAVYRSGAFTVNDGVRYVFNSGGYLAKGAWVDEPGYGRAYGRPSDGAAYRGGAFTVNDGVRYVFNSGGYLAKGAWVDEPGYGRAYGRPSDGAAYRGGVFTVSDGIRYVFNSGGYLAKGAWVDEPGYGRAYGRPSDGVAYKSGAFTLHDGYRYVFNNYGVLAKGQWVYEEGYGKTYGDPVSGRSYQSGAYWIKDGKKMDAYVFNDIGYLQTKKAWVFNKDYGWTYALDNGKPYRNTIKKIGNKLYAFNNNGYLANGYKKSKLEAFDNKVKYQNVKLIIQNPELPNGCEVSSLAIALTSLGAQIDKIDLYNSALSKVDFYYDNYKTYASSPEHAYVGNAMGNGWYCFEEPIIEAGNHYLNKNNFKAKMKLQSGLSIEKLDDLVKSNCPVISWVTLDYSNPQYSSYSWHLPDGTHYLPYRNLHCVVVAGMKGNNYLVANPINGWEYVNKNKFWNAFDKMGRRAVIVN